MCKELEALKQKILSVPNKGLIIVALFTILLFFAPMIVQGASNSSSGTGFEQTTSNWTERANLSLTTTSTGYVFLVASVDGRVNSSGNKAQGRFLRNGVVLTTVNLTESVYLASGGFIAAVNLSAGTYYFGFETSAPSGKKYIAHNWTFFVSDNSGGGSGGNGNVSEVIGTSPLSCSGTDVVTCSIDTGAANFRNDTLSALQAFVNDTFLPTTTYAGDYPNSTLGNSQNCSALGSDYYTYWNGSANLCRQDQTSAFSIKANSEVEITGSAILADGTGVTLTQVGSTITISVPAAGITNASINFYAGNASNLTTGTVPQARLPTIPEANLLLNYPTHAQAHDINGSDHTGLLNWSKLTGIIVNLTNTSQLTGSLADTYISNAATWNAKLDGASGSGPIVVTESPANTITISTTFTNNTAQITRGQVTGQTAIDDWQNSTISCDYSYCIRLNGSTVEAVNGTNGSVEFSGTDYVTVQNSVSAKNPSSISLGAGRYNVTAAFDLPDQVIFSGQGNRTILSGADNNVIHAQTNRSLIQDMMITCNGYSRKGVYIYNSSNTVVDNVEVDSCNLIYSAINFWNVQDSEVRNSIVRDSEEAINIAGLNSGAINNKVYGNSTDSNPDNGITLGVTNIPSYDLYAYDNYIEGNIDGLYVWNVERPKVERNILNQTNKGIIFCCNSYNGSIKSNYVNHITSTLDFAGIHIEAGNDGNEIRSNTVSDMYQDGIRIEGANKTIVEGNTLTANKRNGFMLNSGSNNTIRNNYCYNNNIDNTATASGMRIINGTNNLIEGNKCWDDRATKLQKYGITLSGSLDSGNIVQGNFIENSGVTANILTTTTSKFINNYGAAGTDHGLSTTCTSKTAFGTGDTCTNSTTATHYTYNGSAWVPEVQKEQFEYSASGIVLDNGTNPIVTGQFKGIVWNPINGSIDAVSLDGYSSGDINISMMYNLTGTPTYPQDVFVTLTSVPSRNMSVGKTIAYGANISLYVNSNTGSLTNTNVRWMYRRS